MRWWLMVGLGLFLLAPLQGQENTAPEAKEQELQQLRERVAALERLVQLLQAELAALKRNGVPLTSSSPQTHLASAPQSPSDEEKRQLEQELQRELAQAPPTQQPAQRPSPSYGAVVFGGGLWQALNPDTSVIANFRTGFRGKRPFAAFAGSEFSEAELAFQAYTDPFTRLDSFIAVSPEGAEIEEATLSVLDPTFLRLPRNLQIRLGRLLAPFGQLNSIHPPEQPFVDTPLVHRLWFGHEHGNGDHEHLSRQLTVNGITVPAEGIFSGDGLSLNWMLPTGRYVTWLTLAALNTHNRVFDADAGRPLLLARARTMLELSPTQTLGIGLNYAFGRNDLDENTRLFGIDLTYRWRPLREGLYRSLVWQTEAYFGKCGTGNGDVKPKGWFTLLEYQLSRTLFLGARCDFAQAPNKSFSGHSFSLAITLFPSEFGRYRLQWSRLKIGGQTVHELWLQTTFSIGIHRPHPL